jgi:hypothetical protein
MKSLSSIKQNLITEEIQEEIPEDVIEINLEEDHHGAEFNPPTVLILRRKAVRVYPDNTRVALYYNDKLQRYFSVPFTAHSGVMPVADAPVEAHESVNEAVMDTLHKIVKDRQAQTVKFANGKSQKVDGFTASAMVQVHNALNDENKKKYSDMVHKSPAHFEMARSFAFKHVK